MSTAPNALFRKLPSIDELLHSMALAELVAREGVAVVTGAARAVLARMREEITAGRLNDSALELALGGIAGAVEREVKQSLAHSLVPVINATGVILHTNLGRAPLSHHALKNIVAIGRGYSNLEFDLSTGERGKRDVHAARAFDRLFAGKAPYATKTIVVNNCAAAVLLGLNALAEGGEVLVSRGELVEIGGSFRVPDVMAKSGAVLREVGTTNRTRLADYENAITERTKLILRVHRSNFAMVGFTEQPALAELVELGKKRNIPVMEDLGNGAMLDLAAAGLTGEVKEESGVFASLRAGVDLITYSGDKLLGGPQAGIITGRAELVARLRSNPLFRALRVDKVFYAALEATLLDYQRGDLDSIPTLRMMRLKPEEIRERAEAIRSELTGPGKLTIEIMDGESVIGGGTTPGASLPTVLLALIHSKHNAEMLQAKLRASDPPIIARVEEGRVLLDLRTVFPAQDAIISDSLNLIHHSGTGEFKRP